MIIHRMSTQPPEPPVRFYKVIALSFLFLAVVLLGLVIFITSRKATITIMTKQDTEPITLSVSVGTIKADHVLDGAVNTKTFSWSQKFEPTGDTKVEGVATGQVVLYNKTGAELKLVKTTRVLSAGGVLFRLTSAASLPANGQVTAEVYADKKGESGDIGPSKFTIPGLALETQKLVYAESKTAMSGGLRTESVLSNEDITNAKREYEKKTEDAFLKTLTEPAAGMQRVVSVVSNDAAADHAVGEKVSEFNISGTSTMVVVEYKTNDLQDMINAQAEGKIDADSERFLSLSNSPDVTVASYDAKENSASLNVRQEIAVTLDANSQKLSPENFYGKHKDEIERYVLGIDHVAGVDVKFSPSWVFSAPSVADRITVLVKNIK